MIKMKETEAFMDYFIEIPLREDAKKQLDLLIQLETERKLTLIMEKLYEKQKIC